MVISLPKIPYIHRIYLQMYGSGQPYVCHTTYLYATQHASMLCGITSMPHHLSVCHTTSLYATPPLCMPHHLSVCHTTSLYATPPICMPHHLSVCHTTYLYATPPLCMSHQLTSALSSPACHTTYLCATHHAVMLCDMLCGITSMPHHLSVCHTTSPLRCHHQHMPHHLTSALSSPVCHTTSPLLFRHLYATPPAHLHRQTSYAPPPSSTSRLPCTICVLLEACLAPLHKTTMRPPF
jgi:hypothetical protein